MPARPLTEALIRSLASRETFERGRDYWQRGAVGALVRRGDELAAEVEGSEISPYRVTIRLDKDGIAEARCTCPFDWGGYCKHIVATLLKFVGDPGCVTARPALQELLSGLDLDALVALIVRRLESDPDLAGWIEAELAAMPRHDGRTTVDPQPIAAQAHTVLAGRYRERRYWDDYRSSGDAAELHALVEKAVPFLEAGDGRNALRILEAVAEAFVDDWIEYSSGSDEDMYTLFADLGRMIAEAVLMSDLAADERGDLATTLEDWESRLADYGVEDGFFVAIRATEAGWSDPALQAVLAGESKSWPPAGVEDGEEHELTMVRLRVLDALDRTEAYLNLAHAVGAKTNVATMLVRLDRVPEALVHARKNFTAEGEALELAKALRDAGRHDEALAIAEAGLRFDGNATEPNGWSTGGGTGSLAHWLRDYAAGMGQGGIALTAARTAFEATLSLSDYRAAESLAGEGWKTVRNDLLARLATARYAPDRTEIFLGEGLVDDAVRCVGDGAGDPTGDAVLLRLMEAAHASHSDWVIRLAERKAARIMEDGAAGSYDLAAKWLERAALAYDAAGRIDEWTAVIEELIAKHRRKYKLRPLLEALRCGR